MAELYCASALRCDAWLVEDLGATVSALRDIIGARRLKVAVVVSVRADTSFTHRSADMLVKDHLARLAAAVQSPTGSPLRRVDAPAMSLLAALVPAAARLASYSDPLVWAGLPVARGAGFPLLELEPGDGSPLLRVCPAPPPEACSRLLSHTPTDPLRNALAAASRMAPDPLAAGVVLVESRPAPSSGQRRRYRIIPGPG